MNGKQEVNRIPPHQVGVFACTTCKDTVFEVVNGLQFMFDKLAPHRGMKPIPVMLYRCIHCNGYLRQDKDGSFSVVHREEMLPGDEWKKVE